VNGKGAQGEGGSREGNWEINGMGFDFGIRVLAPASAMPRVICIGRKETLPASARQDEASVNAARNKEKTTL